MKEIGVVGEGRDPRAHVHWESEDEGTKEATLVSNTFATAFAKQNIHFEKGI